MIWEHHFFYQRTQNENGNMNNREKKNEIEKKEAEQKHKRNKTNLKTKQMIIIAGAFVSPSVVFFIP